MNIHAQEAVIRCEIALLGTESYQPEKFVFLNLAIKINFKLFFSRWWFNVVNFSTAIWPSFVDT